MRGATAAMPSAIAADSREILEDVQQSLSAAACVMHDMTLFECLDEDLFDLDPEMVPVLEVVQQSVRAIQLNAWREIDFLVCCHVTTLCIV